jgi:hypothetical protein
VEGRKLGDDAEADANSKKGKAAIESTWRAEYDVMARRRGWMKGKTEKEHERQEPVRSWRRPEEEKREDRVRNRVDG